MNPRVQRLRAELSSDVRAFEARVDELAALPDLAGGGPATLAQAAVALHHGYGAIEAALIRVVRMLEGSVPDGPDWHQTLLADAGLAIDAVRPALLRQETAAQLRRLLGFRHFFRHAYGVPFDPMRLEELRQVAVRLRPSVVEDMRAIDVLLGRLAAEV